MVINQVSSGLGPEAQTQHIEDHHFEAPREEVNHYPFAVEYTSEYELSPDSILRSQNLRRSELSSAFPTPFLELLLFRSCLSRKSIT